jgi:ribosomal-protein-alanine N-acetyltransferase
MPAGLERVRLLTGTDLPLVERLLRTSEYVYQRFTLAELPLLLQRYPASGFVRDLSLHGFLLSQISNPSTAWLSGFGVSWSESRHYLAILDMLLDCLSEPLRTRGARFLYYSGNDMTRDWLRDILLARAFEQYRYLFSYDKFDYGVPAQGNLAVRLRPVDFQRDGGSDMAALLAIEEACFEELWRYDDVAFTMIAATHPYFVVAELDGKVVGYQFNALDDDAGYFIRIAVHPSAGGHGVGTRLLAEAMRFFARARVTRIMLNTQDDNARAHRLYEQFGFIRLPQQGFVLRRKL